MSYSDDELLSMAQSYGIKTKRAAVKQPAMDYSNDELLSMAGSYGIKTKPRKQRTLQGGIVEAGAKTADNIVGGVTKLFPESKRFFQASTQQAQERLNSSNDPDYELAKMGATTLGAARVADSVINFLPNVIDQAMNMPANKRRRVSDLARGLYDNSPTMQRLAEKYPGTFEAHQGVAETVMPLPGRLGEVVGGKLGKVLNKRAVTRIADAGVTNAAIGAAGVLDDANRNKRNATPQELALGAASGGLLGAGLHGAGEGVSKLLQKRQNKIALNKKQPKSSPLNLSNADAQIAGNLEGEDAQVFAQLAQAPTSASAPAPQYKAPDPLMSAFGEIETAGPLALKDSIDKAKKQIKAQFDPRDKDGIAEAERALEAAIATNENWQWMEHNARGESGRFEPGRYGPTNHLSVLAAKHPQVPGVADDLPLPAASYGEAGPLRFPDYLDFEQRHVPQKLTDVTRYPGYPDYLDWNTPNQVGPEPQSPGWGEPHAGWTLEDYVNVTQHPDGLRYPEYLDFGGNGGEPPLPPGRPADGEYRKYLAPENYGYNKGKLEATIEMDDEAKLIMEDVAKTKARLYERESQISTLADEYYSRKTAKASRELAEAQAQLDALKAIKKKDRTPEQEADLAAFKKTVDNLKRQVAAIERGGTVTTPDFRVTPSNSKLVLNAQGESLINQLRNKLLEEGAITGTPDPVPEHMQATGTNDGNWEPPDMNILDDEPRLMEMAMAQKEDERYLGKLKDLIFEKYKDRYSMADPAQWPRLAAEIDYKGKKFSAVVERHQESQRLKYAGERLAELESLKDELLQKPEFSRTKNEPGKITPNKNSPLLNGGQARLFSALTGAGMMGADQQANAADGSETKPVPGSAFAIGALLVGAGVIKNPKAITKLVASTAGKVAAKSAFIYADMLDNAAKLDKALGRPLNNWQPSLEAEMLKHQALVLQSQFGVKFASQEQKAFLFQLIRDGQVTPQEALNGTGKAAQHFGGLSQDQRNALVRYYMYGKSMAKVARNYLADVEAFEAQGGQVDRYAKEGLVLLDQALSPSIKPTEGFAPIISKAHGNVMDALFTLNPEHHLLNLTDSIISGGARTGPINMLKAWVDLGADRELAQAFQNSGLFGNFRAERNEIAKSIAKGTLNAPRKELDFGSDKFNADRVFLAGLYQRFQEKAPQYRQLGIKDAKDYAKQLLAGKLDPTVEMDAWAHAGEATMRVLGVDPLRMNRANLQRLLGSGIVSFVSQPLRMARLANEYVREGRTDRLAYMMAATMLLGGSAAIPETIRLAGQAVAPDIEFAVEKAMNDLSLPGMAGNIAPQAKPFIPNVNAKVAWDPIAPFKFGSLGIQYEQLANTAGNIGDTASNLVAGKYGEATDTAWKSAKGLGQLSGARIGPVPVNMMFKGLDAIEQANSGYMPINFYQGDERLANGESLDLDQFEGGRLAPLVDKILPGESQIAAEARMNRLEKVRRKKAGAEPDQYFGDPLKGLSRKTKDVRKERNDDITDQVNRLLSQKN